MLDFLDNNFLSDSDWQVIQNAGYDKRGAATFSSRSTGDSPALLVIDMQTLFIGADVPVLQAIQDAPTMIGERGWRAVEHIVPLMHMCRQHQRPVIYAQMLPHNRPTDDPQLAIVDALTPQPEDTVIQKHSTSLFHASSLADDLRAQGCDSVIIVGNSTSGCVRAAAVDAVQHGFSVFVPYDCVFDRIHASHQASLLDMWMKYATVLSSADLQARLTQAMEMPS